MEGKECEKRDDIFLAITAVEEYLKNLDIKYFEEQCIKDGWERLVRALMEQIKG